MPGVTIIEAMAQTAAIVVGLSMNTVDKDLLVYFMSIEACKFRRKVVPGDVLELHVTVKRGGGRVWKFHGRGLVEGELAAEAEFTAMMDLSKA
jgi:3-hydroxyacyl-[acyl-carrier-protein] dehydratase